MNSVELLALRGFSFDANRVRERLLNRDVLVALEGFSEFILEFFVDTLCDMLGSGRFNITPCSDNSSTGLTLDDKGFVRIVWDGEVVTAALSAAQRYRDFGAVQEKPSFREGNSSSEALINLGPVNSNWPTTSSGKRHRSPHYGLRRERLLRTRKAKKAARGAESIGGLVRRV